MNAPQVIMIVLTVLSLFLALSLHGERKAGYHNFWFTFLGTVIEFAILWWGGFWN